MPAFSHPLFGLMSTLLRSQLLIFGLGNSSARGLGFPLNFFLKIRVEKDLGFLILVAVPASKTRGLELMAEFPWTENGATAYIEGEATYARDVRCNRRSWELH